MYLNTQIKLFSFRNKYKNCMSGYIFYCQMNKIIYNLKLYYFEIYF